MLKENTYSFLLGDRNFYSFINHSDQGYKTLDLVFVTFIPLDTMLVIEDAQTGQK
jgi:hypothetical protein